MAIVNGTQLARLVTGFVAIGSDRSSAAACPNRAKDEMPCKRRLVLEEEAVVAGGDVRGSGPASLRSRR